MIKPGNVYSITVHLIKWMHACAVSVSLMIVVT